MQNFKLKHSIRQMFLAVAGFVVGISLLESGGLANWAGRMEPGVLRSVAVPVAATLNKVLLPLRVGAIREGALDELARIGWTDDAVRLARRNPTATFAARVSAAVRTAPAPPGPAPALIAAATAPVVLSVPRITNLSPLAPVAQGKPRVVGLTGDSMMAVGLSATLMRLAADDHNLRIVRAFRSGTGLARPDVFNWMDEYPAMVGVDKPDIVIVAIGANDGQGFIVDGKVQLFGTEEWRKTYQSRVAGYLAMVESGGAHVVWVGLPPMRLPTYNARIAVINRIVYTVVSHDPRATWLSSASFVADESGEFREFAALANGRTMRLRAEDGIHFSDDGAGLMSSVLVKWLDPPLEAANTRGPAKPASSAQANPVAIALQANPVGATLSRRGGQNTNQFVKASPALHDLSLADTANDQRKLEEAKSSLRTAAADPLSRRSLP
jgi:hypothetical protein